MCWRAHVGLGGFPDLAAVAAAAINMKSLSSPGSQGERDSRSLESVRV